MSNQDIHQFFTDRRHAMDEIPPGDLWGKINTVLDAMPPQPDAFSWVKKWLLLLVTGVALVAGFFYMNRNAWDGTDDAPVKQRQVAAPAASDKKNQHEERAVSVPFHKVVADTSKKESNIKTDILLQLVEPKGMSSNVPKPSQEASLEKMDFHQMKSMTKHEGSGYLNDTSKLGWKRPIHRPEKVGNRIVIKSERPLGEEEYKEFIAKAVSGYEGTGKILIVKVPGRRPFVKKFDLVFESGMEIDSLKLQKILQKAIDSLKKKDLGSFEGFLPSKLPEK